MPEGETTNPAPNTGGDPGTPNAGDGTGGTTAAPSAGDERKFTQADLDRMVQARLAEQNARAKKAAEEAEALKRGDYEKLTAAEKERADKAELKVRTLAARNAALVEAQKLNLHDADAAFKLVQDQIEYDDEGNPKNVAELLKGLAKSSPWMVKTAAPSSGQPANPGQPGAPTLAGTKTVPGWGAVDWSPRKGS